MKRLEEETWGQRLRRAREEAGLSQPGAARLLTKVVIPVTQPEVSRLEGQLSPPATGRQAFLAYLLVLAYGYDPDDFGLADSGAAPLIDKDATWRQFQLVSGGSSSVWTYGPVGQRRFFALAA
jgi:transcriptional regulator with XRE-family HTH domain